MTKVLVDADALVAISKIDDSNHQKALKLLKKLKKPTFYLSPFTVPEVVTVLSYHVSHEAAVSFLERIKSKNLAECEFSVDLKLKTDSIFKRQKKKRTSWFDCYNVALMEVEEFDFIFSFDKFYKDKVSVLN